MNEMFLLLAWNAIPIVVLYIFWKANAYKCLLIFAILFIVSLQLIEYRSEQVKDVQRSIIVKQSAIIELLEHCAPPTTPEEG